MNDFIKQNWYKLLAAVILFGALGSWPYSYYQFLRWTILIIGGYCAYKYFKLDRKILAIIFGVIAILFNPIAPFYLQRETWQCFDVAAALAFLYSVI